MPLFAEHNCGDSKLKCIDCEKQICPKCLVQCPVGNRCSNCTKRFTSHVLQVDAGTIVRALIGGGIAGALFSFLGDIFPTWGFYFYIFVYLGGALAGNLIFKFAGRKIGRKMATAVASGAVLGGFAFVFVSHTFFGALQNQDYGQDLSDSDDYQSTTIQPDDDEEPVKKQIQHQRASQARVLPATALGIPRVRYPNRMAAGLMDYSPFSLSFVIFLLGLVSPFLGWNFNVPGFRR